MTRKEKSCKNCGNFCAYYQRCVDTFIKTNKGTCKIFKEVINGQGSCENWRNKSSSRKLTEENIVRSLDQISEDIMAIKTIMEEYAEENAATHYAELEV